MESETIEDKRRKNVIDNQNFLRNLQLINARDEFKSTVDSVAKPPRKKLKCKTNIDPSNIRRSSRIKSMVRTVQTPVYDENFVLSSDDTSEEEKEDEDDLTSAFISKIDEDWRPLREEKVPRVKNDRPVRKAATNGVKIFQPNTGLEASNVLSKTKSHQSLVMKKLNVAISSSEEEDN